MRPNPFTRLIVFSFLHPTMAAIIFPPSNTRHARKLHPGLIAGIVVAALVGLLLIIGIQYLIYRRCTRSRASLNQQAELVVSPGRYSRTSHGRQSRTSYGRTYDGASGPKLQGSMQTKGIGRERGDEGEGREREYV